MLDIGWTELLVIAVVLIVVVGPKDLPPMLRAFGKMTTNLRKMAGDFRTQFDQALREADMDDVRQTITDAQRFNPANAIREAINPLREMGNEIRQDLQKATTVPSAAETADKLGEGDAVASVDDLLPKPELSMPAVAPVVTPHAAPTAPVPAAATAATAAQSPPALDIAATGVTETSKPAHAPRKARPEPQQAADVPAAEGSVPKPAARRTKATKVAETPVEIAETVKPAGRPRRKPATPKDNA